LTKLFHDLDICQPKSQSEHHMAIKNLTTSHLHDTNSNFTQSAVDLRGQSVQQDLLASRGAG
jgi:hypothetical protein